MLSGAVAASTPLRLRATVLRRVRRGNTARRTAWRPSMRAGRHRSIPVTDGARIVASRCYAIAARTLIRMRVFVTGST